ncbi:MAG: hypothetical protein HFE82_08775 [Erysipelotrichaceae bacterium]|nr:hypothetical protein [Erysipelotrichaceae bacterium]
MKKLMSLLLVLGMCLGLTGCGGDSDTNKGNDNTQTDQGGKTEQPTPDRVSEIFKLEAETTSDGVEMIVAKENGTKKFSMYKSIPAELDAMSKALGISEGTVVYHADGTDSETYLVQNNTVFVTMSNATAESMKENMDAYLKEKDITFDQVEKALKDFK